MRGQRSRAGTSTDARMITYDSHDAFLSVLTPKSTKWCQMPRNVKGQGQGKLPGPRFSVKCSSTHIRFSCLFEHGCARVCIPEVGASDLLSNHYMCFLQTLLSVSVCTPPATVVLRGAKETKPRSLPIAGSRSSEPELTAYSCGGPDPAMLMWDNGFNSTHFIPTGSCFYWNSTLEYLSFLHFHPLDSEETHFSRHLFAIKSVIQTFNKIN